MGNLSFHHIGVASKSIHTELPNYLSLGYVEDSQFFEDKTQGIRGLFLSSPTGPRLELLENLNSKGPLESFLAHGTKMYHLAYRAQNIEEDVADFLKETQAKLICPVIPATYFAKVCFLMLKNQVLVEIVQER